MTGVLLCLGLAALWTSVVTVAITLYDLRTIRHQKIMRRRPHARQWRSRPFIAVQYYGKPSDESLRSLNRGSYRHVAIDYASHDLTLSLHGNAVLSKYALHDANGQLQYRPALRVVELVPKLRFPQTTRQFFAAYRLLAIMPFIKLRSTLNVRPLARDWPIIVRQGAAAWQDNAYALAAWALAGYNVLLLLYVSYVALAADQPVYLLAYGGLFWLWTAWSACSHPLLSAREKITYVLLAPAAFGYFLWRGFTAPLRPLWHVRTRALHRRMLS